VRKRITSWGNGMAVNGLEEVIDRKRLELSLLDDTASAISSLKELAEHHWRKLALLRELRELTDRSWASKGASGYSTVSSTSHRH